jgi:ABC-type lipoprotein export system ATPase subunit
MTTPDPVRPSMLEAVGLSVTLGDREVLHQIDLSVRSGEPVALTGPSGSGKSVLCLALTGVVPPRSGQVLLDGGPMNGTRRVGQVLQSHGLVSDLTAAENVALPLQARGEEPLVIEQQVAQALEAVALSEEADRSVDELSGGERQRVGVARALAADPDILVADEPTSELDPDNRQRVLHRLLAFAASGRILVVATDDTTLLDALGRVVELSNGRVVPAAGR